MKGEKMRAMVLHELGGPVVLEDVDKPRIGPSDALIRVKATGVGLTVVIMKGTPGRVTSYPRILGHEVAGEVVEVGSEVRNVRVGDRVLCHFYLTCGVCGFCRSGRETLCENFAGNVGMACDGGYAEYMKIPALNLCLLPEEIPFVEASIKAVRLSSSLALALAPAFSNASTVEGNPFDAAQVSACLPLKSSLSTW